MAAFFSLKIHPKLERLISQIAEAFSLRKSEPEPPRSFYVIRCPECGVCPPSLVIPESPANTRVMECTHCHADGDAGDFLSYIPDGSLGVWAEKRLSV